MNNHIHLLTIKQALNVHSIPFIIVNDQNIQAVRHVFILKYCIP